MVSLLLARAARNHRGVALSPLAVSIYTKLVAWWQMDDAVGTTIADSHIHALHATGSGTLTFGEATIRSGGSRSILFNGNSHYKLATSLDAYVVGAIDHALFTWYRPTATTAANERSILTSYDTGSGGSLSKNDQLGMYISTSGKPESIWRYGSGSASVITPSTRVLTGGAGYFIGYNKNTALKAVEHWINNVSEAGIAYANEPNGNSLAASLGSLSGQTAYQAAGSLQNLTVFNAVLTADEANWLWNGGAGRSYAELRAASGH